MKKRNSDLSHKDWELCYRYVDEMKREGSLAHEYWEFELEAWATDAERYPRCSTITKLRLRFPGNP